MAKKKQTPTEAPTQEDEEKAVLSAEREALQKSISPEEFFKDVPDASTNQEELDKERQILLRKFLIPKLRSASYRWSPRSEAIKKARKARGVYECAICKSDLKNGEYVLDHKDPVVDMRTGWVDFNTFIDRMFCSIDGFQLICKPCHEIKTGTEVQIRKMYREKKKQEKS